MMENNEQNVNENVNENVKVEAETTEAERRSNEEKKQAKRFGRGKKAAIIFSLVFIALVISFGAVFLLTYYDADETAIEALHSDDDVRVSELSYGLFFDGPSTENALIFYPGAKVEEEAYAPMLHQLAKEGMDVIVVNMPLRLAVLGKKRAERALNDKKYANWYIGGHSMGGAMAASYASSHSDLFKGVVLFGAFTTDKLPENLKTLFIIGEKDSVINWDKVEKAKELAANWEELVIKGGNHAQFGNYGFQRGDTKADIPANTQQKLAIDFIVKELLR